MAEKQLQLRFRPAEQTVIDVVHGDDEAVLCKIRVGKDRDVQIEITDPRVSVKDAYPDAIARSAKLERVLRAVVEGRDVDSITSDDLVEHAIDEARELLRGIDGP